MKKFSTAALAFALAFALASTLTGLAQANDAGSSRCAFLPNAPDKHTVVRGDTLWDISGRFLEHPWCWPQVWGLNRDQIRDPHWIYPGQIVYFDRTAGRLRLGDEVGSAGSAGGIPTLRLSPQIRSSDLAREAVPSIPAHAIEPFLSQPLVVGEEDLQNAPRIVATREGRVLLGNGDIAYVAGELQGNAAFQVFRPGPALRDPVTQEILGHEAIYLGTAKLERPASAPDAAHTLRVTSLKQEIGIGDRLLPAPSAPLLNYVPHPPEQAVDARVVSIYGGLSQAGQNQVVSINRGSQQGLEIGHVLELYRFGGTIVDRTEIRPANWFSAPERKMIQLPDHRYGTLFVFRVFDNISYGLIMEVTDTVQVGDIARAPE